jgi:hypothetical protein
MNLHFITLHLFLKEYILIYTRQLVILNIDSQQILYILFYLYFLHILRYSYFLYILFYLHPPYIMHRLYLLYNLSNSITSTSITRLTVYIENVIGIETKNIKDYTTEDHNIENTIEIIMKTRPERNIIFAIRKDIGLQNIIPKTIRLLMNNAVDNLCIQLKKRLY